VTVNGQKLNAGDAAAVSEEAKLQLTATGKSQVLLFDLN
jgi:redox-sensitive bicupin YhaK (pirin superfamily)